MRPVSGLPEKRVCLCSVYFSLSYYYTSAHTLCLNERVIKSALNQNVSKWNYQCHFLAKEHFSHNSSVCLVLFVLPIVNTIHISRLLTLVRLRMQDGYIYKCFPLASWQPWLPPMVNVKLLYPPTPTPTTRPYSFSLTPTTTTATTNLW